MSWSTDLRDSHKLRQCHFMLFQLRIFSFFRKAKLPINYKNCSLVARMVVSVKEVTQRLHSHTCLLSKRKVGSNTATARSGRGSLVGFPCVCAASRSIHHKTSSRRSWAQHTAACTASSTCRPGKQMITLQT